MTQQHAHKNEDYSVESDVVFVGEISGDAKRNNTLDLSCDVTCVSVLGDDSSATTATSSDESSAAIVTDHNIVCEEGNENVEVINLTPKATSTKTPKSALPLPMMNEHHADAASSLPMTNKHLGENEKNVGDTSRKNSSFCFVRACKFAANNPKWCYFIIFIVLLACFVGYKQHHRHDCP